MHLGPAPSERPTSHPRGTLRIGQVFGIDITVRSSWLIVAALIAVLVAPQIELVAPGLGSWSYVAGLAFAVLLYFSVLLHELSHALAAKAYGLPVRSVSLHFLGGVTEIAGEPQTPAREFVVSVVGPLTSLAVGGVCLLGAGVSPDGLLQLALSALAGANLIVGVLNLAPGLPLDGGRVLRALVWAVSGRPHLGTLVAGWAGRVLAVVVLALPLVLSVVTGWEVGLLDYVLAAIVGVFLWAGAGQAMAAARIRSRLPALQARRLARRAIAVPQDLPLSEAVRRAQAAQAGGLIVIAGDDAPIGVVSEAALLATPEERRPWVTCGSVARRLEPGLVLDADLSGEQLVAALQSQPASEYVVVDRGGLFGVLATKDVDAAVAAV